MTAAIKDQPWRAATIDDVIKNLGEIIDRSIEEKSRIGFFAALYRKVTVKVKEGISQGFFDDSPRMERLDVAFANRYLQALHQYQTAEKPTAPWQLAFNATERWTPIILQELLLGMNAHINLDLGIAAAQIAPGDALLSLHDDFNKINTILASLVNQVQDEIDQVSPWINFLDNIDRSLDDSIINFSMTEARNHAWDVAVNLSKLSPDQVPAALARLEKEVEKFGHVVLNPGFFFKFGLMVIRSRESNDIPRIIRVLESVPGPTLEALKARLTDPNSGY